MNQDPDVSEEIQRLLVAEDIHVVTSAEIIRVDGHSGSEVTLTVRTPSAQPTFQASHILVATGRTPNTAGIGLEQAGVELLAGGWISVNDQLETTSPQVWAIGECAGSPQFTHVAFDDFRIVRDNRCV